MYKPDRDDQIATQDVHASTENFDRLRWLFQNSESADKRLLGSRPARPHRARHLLNVLAYEPRSSAAILAFLCVAVIVMTAFPSFWENGPSSESEAVPTKLSSLSAEPALAKSTAVHTARSASISSDRNQPYGMLQGAAPDNGPGESLRFSVPSNDLAAPSSLSALPVAKSIADGLLRIGLHQARAEAEGSPATTTSSSTMVTAADPSTTPDVSSVSIRGVSDKEIRFGIVAPFSGSAKELGRQMKIGIETVFSVVNEAGGVSGRQLKLFSADDGYEPTRTGAAMKQLWDTDQIFGIIGNVGTPTAAVALPFALDHKMLFFGAFTGANLLRQLPPDHYVFNYRASYSEETEAALRYLVNVRGVQPNEIAVFAQQDSYGDAGYEGVAKAVRALRGGYTEPILRLNYKRNTVDVADAVARLQSRKSSIKAIVMVAAYRAAANFIVKTRDRYPNMIYTNVSFVGSTALSEELVLQGERFADGVIVTQVVPAVSGYSRAVLDYKTALAKYFPGERPDYVSFEGYVVAKILVEALRRVGPQLDTEKLIDTLEGIHDLDMGLGTLLNFGPSEHQASHKVWGTQLDKSGHFRPIDLD
jgi:ABC-type branched-subunit amino acid transport system substrate-binding protein